MSILAPVVPKEERRAVFFGLLNPQPDQFGFAGVQTDVGWDLGSYTSLKVKLRAKGGFDHFKLYLFDDKKTNENWLTGFTTFFEVPCDFSTSLITLINSISYLIKSVSDIAEEGRMDREGVPAS